MRIALRGAAAMCLALCCSSALFAAADRPTVLIEAEGFETFGGWVIDQQYMDQMGSPVLLAHGLGRPVEDAVTTVDVPVAGQYRVWVRTRDWAATFAAPGTPGKFQLLVDGKPLKTTFGTQGAEWHWQDGGIVKIPAGKVKLALHDLTGFDGRCDAVLLTTADVTPPNSDPEMAQWRRELLGLSETPRDAGSFDLVVVGGGMAGCCAAVSAARLGMDVALIQNRPVLGGNNSSEVRVSNSGRIHLPPYPALGGLVREVGPPFGRNGGPAEQFADERKREVVEAEPTLQLFLNTHVFDARKQGDRITAVLGKNIRTGKVLRFPGRWFADCTGDGNLGFLVGADFRYGRESREETGESLAVEKSDRQTMGTSVMWGSRQSDRPSGFPETPWAIQFNEQTYQRAARGDWNWETGFRWDQIKDFEKVRDNGLRAVFGNWSYQKNHAPDKEKYANAELAWVAYVGGKRESRRLLGDVILQQQDVDEAKLFPDASVTCTWSIDLHYPKHSDQFPGEEFRSYAEFHRVKPYPIPYRCFYSRNIENLFMAGRCISVTHVALGTVRVMKTCGMMGEVVGMAASVCKKHNGNPRDVYAKHLDELKALMTKGVSHLPVPFPPKPPDWLPEAGPNLARNARATASSEYKKARYPASNVNDGRVSYTDNSLRYVSDEETPTHVELTWEEPQTINATRIVTGQNGGTWPQTPITNFVIQYHDGNGYRDIPQTKITGNETPDWHTRFEPVTTKKLRLTVTKTPGDLTRIWEWEVYHLLAASATNLEAPIQSVAAGMKSTSRRDFLKFAGAGVASLFLAAGTGGPIALGGATTGDRWKTILLSKTGGDRGTAYVMSNKIARRNGNLVCTWIDSARQNRWAAVDPASGKVLEAGTVGGRRRDNHCGAAIATDVDGTLHLVVGAHHGPFAHYRMSADEMRWAPVEDGREVAQSGTYPSLVCDGEGTLHLTYRHEPGGRNARLYYCRRPKDGKWSKPRSLVENAVSEHSWLTNAIEVGPKNRLHVAISNTLPVPDAGPLGRYYGASHLYSDDAGETWRQFGVPHPLELPAPAARLKRIESDTIDPQRVEPHYGGERGPRHSYYHKILLSNPVVDDLGRPWVIVHNLLGGQAELFCHRDDDGWKPTPLAEAVRSVFPGFGIRHCGQLSRHRDGTIEVVLMVAPEKERGWGTKGTELVRLLADADGVIRETTVVRSPDPELPHWLPSLERWCWHAPVDSPALLFTRGINAGGYSHNVNQVDTEIWLQLPSENAGK